MNENVKASSYVDVVKQENKRKAINEWLYTSSRSY